MSGTLYPGAQDDNTSLPNPGVLDSVNSANPLLVHNYQHNTANDAIKAIEAKLGVTASTPNGSSQVLYSTGVGLTVWGNPPMGGDLAGSFPNPTVPGLAGKQATLVSGVNIATINGNSLLTGGNITITGGGGGTWGSITGTLSSQTDLQAALNAKQNTLTLTTTGTSGAATLVGSTLNIPSYSSGGAGTITGPGSTTNNDVALWSGTTGTVLKDSVLSVGAGGMLYVSGTQIEYVPNQSTLTGTLIFGDGGANLSHVSGSDGQYNTVVGLGAAPAITTGNQNIAMGYQAMNANTTGSNNFAFGYQAGKSWTTATNNFAIGTYSLVNATGSGNMGIGYNATASIGSGSNSVGIGNEALMNATGSSNTSVGYGAIHYGAAGGNNVSIGTETFRNPVVSNSVAIGMNAGYSVGGGTYSGEVLVGYQSGYNLGNGANNNTLIGYQSGYTNAAGMGIVALGNSAGFFETGSNAFYVGNIKQTNLANDKAYSLLYGTFSGTAGSLTGQGLTVNGTLALPSAGTPGASKVLTSDASGNATWQTPGGAGSTIVNYYQPTLADQFTYAATNVFTLTQTPTQLVGISVNGQLLTSSEYSNTGTSLTVTPTTHTFVAGDIILAIYDGTSAYSSTGGFTAGVRTVTATGAVASTDYLLRVNSASATTQTLPDATLTANIGREYVIKNVAAGAVTIATTSSQTIDASTTYSLATQYKYVRVQSNGVSWDVTGNN